MANKVKMSGVCLNTVHEFRGKCLIRGVYCTRPINHKGNCFSSYISISDNESLKIETINTKGVAKISYLDKKLFN